MDPRPEEVRRTPRHPDVPRNQPGAIAVVDLQGPDGETPPEVAGDPSEAQMAEPTHLQAIDPAFDEGSTDVGSRQDADGGDQRQTEDDERRQHPAAEDRGMAPGRAARARSAA